MPIQARHQIFTFEDKLTKVIEILSLMRNQADADFLKRFIFETCYKAMEAHKELEKYTNPQMQKFEAEFFERIAKELNIEL